MNENPKPKFYKRPWFLLVAGMIIGPAVIFLALLVYANRNQIASLPGIRDARNAAVVATKKTIKLSNCAGDPPSVQLSVADYSSEQNNGMYRVASVSLINLDSQKHKIAMNGVMGELTIPANGTTDIPFAGNKDGVFTCDGKDSFTVKIPTAADISGNSPATKYRQAMFNSLSGEVQSCANSVLGANGVQELLNGTLKITADGQTSLSSCIYESLPQDGKNCAAALSDGDLNAFFKNVPQDKLADLGKCMGVERYNSLLVIPQTK